MVQDHKVSQFSTLRYILLVILCITFAVGAWRILTDTTSNDIPEANKIAIEEKNVER